MTLRGSRESRQVSLGALTVIAQFLLQMHNKKMSYLENNGQNELAQNPQWQISKIYKRNYKFSFIFTISETLVFQFFYIENLG